MKKRPLVLSIAGFDPTGGAGILADIKTFEQTKVLGMGAITANTIQTENKFVKSNWVEETVFFEQLEQLLQDYKFSVVKIGLIPNLEFLLQIISHPKLEQTKIIWDPILSTSTGFDFKHNLEILPVVLPKIDLITPNWNEIKKLSSEKNAQAGAQKLAQYTNVYLKGGHSDIEIGKDYLFSTKGKVYPFKNRGKRVTEKHGSGCVFSSALTAYLALGFPIIKACLKSKKYTTNFLESNTTQLGYHKF